MKRETLNLIELGLAGIRRDLGDLRNYRLQSHEVACDTLHRLGNHVRQLERDIYASENQGALTDAANTVSN